MMRSRFGMIASFAGAALSVWYWRRRTHHRHVSGEPDRGEVIFRNTPHAADL